MRSYETYELKQEGKPLHIEAWIFCESKTSADPRKPHYSGSKDFAHQVRFYITKRSRVVLECIQEYVDSENKHFVSEHETLEDAVNELALFPVEIITSKVYNLVMDDMLDRASSNQDDD